jgi:hypothetical protein
LPEHVRLVRLIILECIHRNRSGNTFQPLHQVILLKIRSTIGPTHFQMAQELYCVYVEERRTQSRNQQLLGSPRHQHPPTFSLPKNDLNLTSITGETNNVLQIAKYGTSINGPTFMEFNYNMLLHTQE